MLSSLRNWWRTLRASRRQQADVPAAPAPRDPRLAARAHFWKEVREGRLEAEARRARPQS